MKDIVDGVPIILLGTPSDITDPVVFLEHLMRRESRGRLLTYLARRLRRNNGIGEWFTKYWTGESRILWFECHVCEERFNTGFNSWCAGSKKGLATHGKEHVQEVLDGKYKESE